MGGRKKRARDGTRRTPALPAVAPVQEPIPDLPSGSGEVSIKEVLNEIKLFVKKCPCNKASVYKIVYDGKVVFSKEGEADAIDLDNEHRAYTNLPAALKGHFVEYFGMCMHDGYKCLVTKSPGEDFVHVNDLAREERAKFIGPMASLLTLMHSLGFYHGDLHSGNFLVDPKTLAIKLLDPTMSIMPLVRGVIAGETTTPYTKFCVDTLGCELNDVRFVALLGMLDTVFAITELFYDEDKGQDSLDLAKAYFEETHGWTVALSATEYSSERWSHEVCRAVCASISASWLN